MKKKTETEKLIREIEKLKDKKGYIQAGIPRFKGLFGRDSLIVAWQLLNYDPSIAEKTILILASLQGKNKNIKTGEEPGKILHEYYPKDTPDDWWKKYKEDIKWLKRGKPVYMSVDSTPLFLIVLGMYLEKTNNFSLARKIKKNIKRAADWMIEYGDKNKNLFIEYQRESQEGLLHQAWKDSDMKELNIEPPVAIVEAQGYQYLALKYAAKIMKKMGENNISIKYSKRATKLKKEFNRIFWSKKNGYFILALGKGKTDKKTSNPGHLLFTGIVSKKRAEKIIKKLFGKDMLTPYGIRTYSSKEEEFNVLAYHLGTVWPHDNWIIAQGLKKMGYNNYYKKIKKSLFAAYKKLGFLPELYGVSKKGEIVKYREACYLQAWAVGSLISFLLD